IAAQASASTCAAARGCREYGRTDRGCSTCGYGHVRTLSHPNLPHDGEERSHMCELTRSGAVRSMLVVRLSRHGLNQLRPDLGDILPLRLRHHLSERRLQRRLHQHALAIGCHKSKLSRVQQQPIAVQLLAEQAVVLTLAI